MTSMRTHSIHSGSAQARHAEPPRARRYRRGRWRALLTGAVALVALLVFGVVAQAPSRRIAEVHARSESIAATTVDLDARDVWVWRALGSRRCRQAPHALDAARHPRCREPLGVVVRAMPPPGGAGVAASLATVPAGWGSIPRRRRARRLRRRTRVSSRARGRVSLVEGTSEHHGPVLESRVPRASLWQPGGARANPRRSRGDGARCQCSRSVRSARPARWAGPIAGALAQ